MFKPENAEEFEGHPPEMVLSSFVFCVAKRVNVECIKVREENLGRVQVHRWRKGKHLSRRSIEPIRFEMAPKEPRVTYVRCGTLRSLRLVCAEEFESSLGYG
jgi:hypothetical protein